MALLETSLIWVTYGACLGALALVAALFIFVYEKPGERDYFVTLVAGITTFALLATVLLTPVDIALTSSTVNRHLGQRKDWATPDAVDSITFQLKNVYYLLYSLDAILCLLVTPFAYFWYEEYDEVEASEGEQTTKSRFWGALKYSVGFLVLVLVLFLVGFFIPVAKKARHKHHDLDYFKHLLTENHGERALTFSIGVLIAIGTVLYCFYVAPGLALRPLSLIKSAPAVSAPQFAATTSSQLAQNRERQRQLEARANGRDGGLDSRDQRELEGLLRDERTLARRERLVEARNNESKLLSIWHKACAVFRPLELLGGLLLLVISWIIFVSMLITCIDKIKNSICGARCGYILGHTQIFQPVNWLMTVASRVFPVDYVLFLLLTLLFFSSAILGLSTIGVRFLWVTIFRIRKGKTTPNAMLMAIVLLTLMNLALNYSLAMIVAPQYATFGPQTFCDRPARHPDEAPDCSHHRSAVRPCSERASNSVAGLVCTPSVASTFLNSIAVNYPLLGAITFWAQFAFLGIYAVVCAVMMFRVPKFDDERDDEEEEGLLAATNRRMGATWEDLTGRAEGVRRMGYGTGDDSAHG
ncbi:hypothetical protein K470DRAFT_300651 [Piedraia hortae CBS 480.64]|uniref:Probable lysosomal cobalamin transporter n=1 Tax=Piedraia hortae CBS 480.64 TaxID=1314780 RepID=A0A6A7BUE5_9PEZI|nr:hypothetical protein K470DRAFT_300651 [Piedraia hortae CBS 480.64]